MNLKAAGTTIILLLIYTMGPSSLAGSRSLRFHDLFYFKSEMYPSPMGNVEAREISAKPQAHPIFFYQNLPWTL
ncbi:MAG: hypothetical protein KDD40_03835, partial [Bdellovibrionales bacterium]|nr:hypothetical protein [Bdellovibrionales bacterium]